ncbi:MAG: hypothetical protein MUF22_00885 [Chitinispirillaceae bacterium]|nr:hypothetical protein [Chitinispirillaceae bacterium]
MKRFFLCALLLLVAGNLPAAGHRILVGGASLGYTAVVGIDGKIEWKFAEPNQNNDVWLLPNGNIIWSYSSGVKIVKPVYGAWAQSKVVWNRLTPAGGETHSCQPLENSSSKFLVGESYDTISYIIEVDTTGKIWKKIALPRFGSGAHNQFRQIRKTPLKTYLVTQQTNLGKAFEYDSTGKLLRTFPDGRYVAERLTNDNTLIACGDVHRVIEVSPANSITWQCGQNDIQGTGFTVSLGFVAGIQRLANGNTIICNWGGHGGAAGPAVIEITPAKKLVWSLDTAIQNRVSAFQLLDDCDSVRPAVLSAAFGYGFAQVAANKVIVQFSKELDSLTASASANYSIKGATITSAMLQPGRKSVVLTLSANPDLSKNLTLSVSNVLDDKSPANKILAGSTVGIVIPVGVLGGYGLHGLDESVSGMSPIISLYSLDGRLVRRCKAGETMKTLQKTTPAGSYILLVRTDHQTTTGRTIVH